jgi:hypothetical protein
MRASPRFAWGGGPKGRRGQAHLFRHSRPLSFAATAWTHLPEGGYRIANPLCLVKAVSAVSASDMAIGGGKTLEAETLIVGAGQPKVKFPTFPPVIWRQRRVAGTAGIPGTPARRHVPPPKAGCRRLRTIDGADHGGNPSAGLRGKSYRELKYKSSSSLVYL